jgi:hypothetical protein
MLPLALRSLLFLSGFALAAPPASPQECVAEVWSPPLSPQLVVDSNGALFLVGTVEPGVWGVARRDGSNWTLLPGEFDGRVRDVARRGAEVLVGGDFNEVDGLAVGGVALFDGTGWQALGSGVDGTDPTVHAVEFFGDELVVGGDFDGAGGVASPNLARFAGGAWTDLAGGLDGEVRDLVVFEDRLVVGGAFTDAGRLGLASVAAWDGALLAPLGATVLDPVDRLDVDGAYLAALANGLLWIRANGDWFHPANQPLDVDARQLAFHDGGIVIAGRWVAFCLAWNEEPCLARSKYEQGQWTFLGFDEQFPTLDWLSLATTDGTLYETGGTDGLIQYTQDPVLYGWTPTEVGGDEAFTFSLSMGCAIAGAPVVVALGDLPPVALQPDDLSFDVPAGALGQTGPVGLTLRQGTVKIEVAGAVKVLPTHALNYLNFFGAQLIGSIQTHSDEGAAVYYAALDLGVPVSFDGVFSPAHLDLSQTVLLGFGAPQPIFGGFPGNLNLPLTTALPPGLEFYSQALVVESNPEGGLFIALTPLVQTALP